jgi:hypothetical protein
MKIYSVITSINEPSEAVLKLSSILGANMIVIGDQKSPKEWIDSQSTFLDIEDQKKCNYKLEAQLPYNHYCRKNIGYLKAIKEGADIIYDTDDDNILHENLVLPSTHGPFLTYPENFGFVNIYRNFSDEFTWPRGFPLNKIREESFLATPFLQTFDSSNLNVKIWQGLVDNEPDVDAIYRLLFNKKFVFRQQTPIVLPKGAVCPFNSQSTFFAKDVFPLLYLPATVSFRFTDILRGLVAQPILWLYDYQLSFISPIAYQNRNEHNLMSDFESEISCYLDVEKVVEIVINAIDGNVDLNGNLLAAYSALMRAEIVEKKEIEFLKAWLYDLR